MNQFFNEILSPEVTTVSAIFKLIISMILGGLIGLERKQKGQNAGIRTFALICMGATLAMLISIYVPQVYLGLKNGDPGRIAAQVISGIGFLGAGAIIQMKGSVRGLTTAAGIWMVAIIGMTVGLGMYLLAVVGTLLVVVVLHWFELIEHRVSMGAESRIIRVKIKGIVTDIDIYKEALRRNHVALTSSYIDYSYDEEITRLNLIVLLKSTTDCAALFEQLRQLNPTLAISLATQISI
jgi:putative Mg2+ transporter-C (MgtC) family protein